MRARGAADERRSGAHVGAHGRRRLVRLPAVHDPRARRRGSWRASSTAAPSRPRRASEVLAAIARADAIVIGPSNPLASIGPILAVPGIHDALAAARAPVVAVSPIVERRGAQGPHRGVHGVRRAGLQRRGRRGLLRRAARRDRRRRERRAPGERCAPTRAWTTPPGGARVAEETLSFAQALAG